MSLSEILDQPTANCVLKLAPAFVVRCECASCRGLRGQTPDELLAAVVAEQARNAWRLARRCKKV